MDNIDTYAGIQWGPAEAAIPVRSEEGRHHCRCTVRDCCRVPNTQPRKRSSRAVLVMHNDTYSRRTVISCSIISATAAAAGTIPRAAVKNNVNNSR